MSKRTNYVPTHPELFAVEFKPGEYSSSLVARKASPSAPPTPFGTISTDLPATFAQDFAEGERVARLEGLTKGPKAYSSVQCGPNLDDHIELNSDLLYGRPSSVFPRWRAGQLTKIVVIQSTIRVSRTWRSISLP